MLRRRNMPQKTLRGRPAERATCFICQVRPTSRRRLATDSYHPLTRFPQDILSYNAEPHIQNHLLSMSRHSPPESLRIGKPSPEPDAHRERP